MSGEVAPGVRRLALPAGYVNAYLVDGGGELALIDAGMPRRAGRILGAVSSIGRRVEDVRNIVVTHYHADHIGSLAVVSGATRARVWAHPADAGVVRSGGPIPFGTAPTAAGKVLVKLFGPFTPRTVGAAPVHEEIADGQDIPVAGGMRVVHTPGHTPGHVSLLWAKVLFVGDAAGNIPRLGYAIMDEDHAAAKASLAKLAALDFDVAVFGHGFAIKGKAVARMRRRLEQLAK